MLLIFQNKKTTDLRVKTWGDKRHVIPPMSKHGGDISPPSPPGFTPLPIIMISTIRLRKFNHYLEIFF